MFGLDETASAAYASSLKANFGDITIGLHTVVPQAAAEVFLLFLVPGGCSSGAARRPVNLFAHRYWVHSFSF